MIETAQIEQVKWCEEARVMLSKIDRNYNIEDIKSQIENGADLYRMFDASGTILYYVLTIAHLRDYSEGVVFAAAGNREGVDITKTIIPFIEKQLSHCKYLRIHTARTGLIKKLYNLGFEFQEMVLRKELQHA